MRSMHRFSAGNGYASYTQFLLLPNKYIALFVYVFLLYRGACAIVKEKMQEGSHGIECFDLWRSGRRCDQ